MGEAQVSPIIIGVGIDVHGHVYMSSPHPYNIQSGGDDAMKMKEALAQVHSGIGGLYFICTMVICSFIMFTAVKLSWDSQAIAIADNIAYITSINTTINGYIDNADDFSGTYNGYLPNLTNHPYAPLRDFNDMLTSLGIVDGVGCDRLMVSWTNNSTYGQSVLQYGSFKTKIGSYITPHQQESIIEND